MAENEQPAPDNQETPDEQPRGPEEETLADKLNRLREADDQAAFATALEEDPELMEVAKNYLEQQGVDDIPEDASSADIAQMVTDSTQPEPEPNADEEEAAEAAQDTPERRKFWTKKKVLATIGGVLGLGTLAGGTYAYMNSGEEPTTTAGVGDAAGGAFDANGNPIQVFDANGNPIPSSTNNTLNGGNQTMTGPNIQNNITVPRGPNGANVAPNRANTAAGARTNRAPHSTEPINENARFKTSMNFLVVKNADNQARVVIDRNNGLNDRITLTLPNGQTVQAMVEDWDSERAGDRFLVTVALEYTDRTGDKQTVYLDDDIPAATNISDQNYSANDFIRYDFSSQVVNDTRGKITPTGDTEEEVSVARQRSAIARMNTN